MDLKLKRLPNGQDLPLPAYQTEGAAGMDVRTAESYRLWGGETKAFATGFAIEVPAGHEAQVRSRGGLAAKGIFVTNGPGTIDEDYRGEIMVILTNSTQKVMTLHRGDRIAQLVIAPVTRVGVVEVDELSSTVRGEGRFASTGS
jgi:dUTP pyrophosphatase